MDDDIARLYADRGLSGVRPRFAYPLIRLAHTGPLTIKELAESLGLTHSAVSQTVTALRIEGLARTVQGTDARTRLVELTVRGRELVPFLEAEWRSEERRVGKGGRSRGGREHYRKARYRSGCEGWC